MFINLKNFFVFSAIFLISVNLFAAESEPQRSENVEAQLVTDVMSIMPGTKINMALRLKMDRGWHTYWLNPGDSGLPTEIQWTLPDGFSSSEINWPLPEKIDTPPLVTYGYHDEIYLFSTIAVPADLKAGNTITIAARVDWLECEEVCIPGGVDLKIDLPVKENAPVPDEQWSKIFADARTKLPLESSEWKFAVSAKDSTLQLQGVAPDWFDSTTGKVIFFPYEYGVIEYSKAQKSSFKDGVLKLEMPMASGAEKAPQVIEGILVSDKGWRGPNSEKAHYINVKTGMQLDAMPKTNSSSVDGILLALVFSFLGGIILNLMPCVLPVLSLKILGFVQQANEDKSQAWKHGAVFTLGVLISFWVLAGSLLALRAGGEQLGWGFQLQEPAFLIILSAFLFLFGLSMFGVFEIGTSLTTIEGKTGRKSGWVGSFVSGVTATVVATPCTAPFMGSALGYALTQPAWASMLIFTFLGLGMAFPYVLLASMPSLLKFVPKPGRWMESMKQFMGFLLVATVLWLLWVLAQQAGAMMVILVLASLLILSIAGWIYGRWGNLAMPAKTRMTSTIVATVITVLTLFFTLKSIDTFAAVPQSGESISKSEGINWQPYSDQLVSELRESGQPLFIDFTAAWCLSCQVNERVAFSSKDVQNKFTELGITPVKADWTSRDENITRALASYGRNSVPLYVYYPAGKESAPVLLPELITPGIVLETFKKNGSKTISVK
ncbi:MAG: thioredoxin family protein [Calditrichae bacterium]|nr:thioredoxin family protein [Calditrichia bacterium]